MSNSHPIRVFVVDDNNLSIDLLTEPLRKAPKLEFFGRANSGEECLKKLKNQDVDVLLMDIQMPGMDGIKTVEKLQKEKGKEQMPKVIFFTVFGDQTYKRKAFELGASIIGKNIDISYLLQTIERAAGGEIIINPNPNGIRLKSHNGKLRFVVKRQLNKEQIRIACMTRNGKTADEIARELDCTTDHVNNQKKIIRERLAVIGTSINSALIGAIMENCGLCQELDFPGLAEAVRILRARS